MKKLFWLSWYELSPDHRPIAYPPSPAILGWWCSGKRCADEAFTLVAYVEAESPEAAKAAVLKDWPLQDRQKEREWRFCDERTEYKPSDRFPARDWMEKRLEPWIAPPAPEAAEEVG